ncbi:hypothetical protein JQ608_06615 [Bradyrhizobium liaoningense]|uniref:hypothetical protein n=1 Tax=Bradyrhizobium liaoningense TaxID=43992 RepID=UPI001BA9B601|nr:hypothetical protein [Bradyrhizobium liaoningense]MBR0876873.1 hypothetical protein [Bradyrhizobium liaoningense]
MPLPAIVYRTTDPLKWGTGKEAPLSAEEFDENYWALVQALEAVSALEPHEIQDISVTPEGQMTILLDGGASFGPFPLPVASLTFRDDWAPATDFKKNDFFREGDGLYLVLQTHTSDGVFSESAGNGLGPYYKLIFRPESFILSFFVGGSPGAGLSVEDPIFGHVAASTFHLPVDLAGSRAVLKNAPASDMFFNVVRNEDVLGIVQFTAGSNEGIFTVSTAAQFAAGDFLTVTTQGEDGSAAHFALTLKCLPGAVPSGG